MVIELFRSLATEKEQRRLELRSKAANSAGCALAARGASALWWTESGRQHLRTLQRQRVARWAAGAAGPGPRRPRTKNEPRPGSRPARRRGPGGDRECSRPSHLLGTNARFRKPLGKAFLRKYCPDAVYSYSRSSCGVRC